MGQEFGNGSAGQCCHRVSHVIAPRCWLRLPSSEDCIELDAQHGWVDDAGYGLGARLGLSIERLHVGFPAQQLASPRASIPREPWGSFMICHDLASEVI